jgi:hypothetical protein
MSATPESTLADCSRTIADLRRIKRGEPIVHVADIREEEVYRAVPTFRHSAELRGVRNQITVALLEDNPIYPS